MGGTGDIADDIAEAYERAVGRVMARSAVSQGTITDQHAGDAAAELGLRRTAALLATLGDPQRAMAIVHVAGSKGKGSTVAMIASILTEAGVRTGRFMSPHLHHLSERIAIDRVDIDRVTFVAVADRVLAAVEALERDRPELGRVHAFEVLFAMALVRFRDAGCAVGVIEVGIGGRLDTTNVVEPAVSVITTLDLEHTAILGDTLAKIAWEKAGIIKPGRPVVTVPHPEEAMAVIRARAAAVGSELTVVQVEDGGRTDAAVLTGAHQALNGRLAVSAVQALVDAGVIGSIMDEAIAAGQREAWLPGRFEVVPPHAVARLAGREDPLADVVLDAAHTPLAARALRFTLDAFATSRERRAFPTLALCGFSVGHDVDAFLMELRPGAVLPIAAASPRSIDATTITTVAERAGVPVVHGPPDVAEALRFAIHLHGAERIIVVTGSFLVVAEARVALGLAEGPAGCRTVRRPERDLLERTGPAPGA